LQTGTGSNNRFVDFFSYTGTVFAPDILCRASPCRVVPVAVSPLPASK
jgi:hypothetical protein